MSLKYRYFCVLLFCLFWFLPVNAHAQSELLNDVYIETKRVDYSNYLLTADIKIHLNLDASEDFSYLILPIRYNSNLRFFVKPNSKRATILSGYLGSYGDFIVQFPPLDQSTEYFLDLTDVQIPINETPAGESFGYYSFSFYDISEDISSYKNNLIFIDRIHIVDNNYLNSIPNAMQENSRNSLLFSFVDANYDISIYISNQPENSNYTLPIILGISAVILGIITGFGLGIGERIKNHIKFWFCFRIVSLALVAFEIVFFYFFVYPRGYYNDLTFMSTISSLFGVTVAISVIVFISTRKHP